MTTPSAPADSLRVGVVPGVTPTKWATIWKDRFRRVQLELADVQTRDQRRVLDAGEVDMCFVRLPIDTEGLHLIPLYDEVPVVWVSKEHPVAAFDEVTTADLAAEPVLEEATQDNIDLVAQEVAVLRVPMSIARSHSRRDLVYRPVTDAPTTTVGLAWRVDNEHPSIDEFIGVVRGRTVNSSRTAQERAAGKPTAKASKPAAGRKRGESGRRPRRR